MQLNLEEITHGQNANLPGNEAALQRACCKYLNALKVLYFHPANGGTRQGREAAGFTMQGVKPGVSDLIILEPRGEKHGLMVELKVKRNTLTDYQIDFLRAAWKRGYAVAVCYTFDSFKIVLDKYLSI